MNESLPQRITLTRPDIDLKVQGWKPRSISNDNGSYVGCELSDPDMTHADISIWGDSERFRVRSKNEAEALISTIERIYSVAWVNAEVQARSEFKTHRDLFKKKVVALLDD